MKPAIFKNELLAVANPLYTLIFEGLWCIADREGRLEDRPAKIHMEINPGRVFEGTNESLNWLAENEFIHRYCIGKVRYIQVINFSKHQNPHQKEAPSKIPKPDASPVQEPDKTEVSPVLASCKPVMDEASAGLIPSSLTPDSGLLTPDPSPPESISARKRRAKTHDPPEFDDFKLAYPARAGSQEWRKALRRALALISQNYTWAQVIDGAKRYAAYVRAIGNEGTQYVKQASVFLGPELHFLEEWPLPVEKVATPRKTKFAQAMEALDRA